LNFDFGFFQKTRSTKYEVERINFVLEDEVEDEVGGQLRTEDEVETSRTKLIPST
jgi:hypothetical protein